MRKGFPDVNAFLRIAGRIQGIGDFLVNKMKPSQKLEIQQVLFRVKQNFQLKPKELLHVFHFMQCRNPLGFTDLKEYCRPTVLMAVVPHYLRWKIESESRIRAVGMKAAIEEGGGLPEEIADEIYALMDELLGEVHRS